MRNNGKALRTTWRVSLLGPHPDGLFERILYSQLDTCDAPVAPLKAPMQGGGLRCSRPGCCTGVAGGAGDGLGGPGTLSALFRGTLPTVITLPAMPHMPFRLSLGLLLVELEKWGAD